VDKLTLSALEATLRIYLDPERARAEIPALAMLTASLDEIRSRAANLAAALQDAGIDAQVVSTQSSPGGGAFPTAELPSCAVALGQIDAASVEERLRLGAVPVIGRLMDGRLLLDLRSVLPHEDAALASAVVQALT
jgi:L-seryl-tRNA(Ser) seleniumtransferase